MKAPDPVSREREALGFVLTLGGELGDNADRFGMFLWQGGWSMRRWMACGVIGTYLLVLVFGLFSHALGYKSTEHVGMYFLVWDMYCGWCGYEVRHHVIAQGESGQYYRSRRLRGASLCRSGPRAATTMTGLRPLRERSRLTFWTIPITSRLPR